MHIYESGQLAPVAQKLIEEFFCVHYYGLCMSSQSWRYHVRGHMHFDAYRLIFRCDYIPVYTHWSWDPCNHKSVVSNLLLINFLWRVWHIWPFSLPILSKLIHVNIKNKLTQQNRKPQTWVVYSLTHTPNTSTKRDWKLPCLHQCCQASPLTGYKYSSTLPPIFHPHDNFKCCESLRPLPPIFLSSLLTEI